MKILILILLCFVEFGQCFLPHRTTSRNQLVRLYAATKPTKKATVTVPTNDLALEISQLKSSVELAKPRGKADAMKVVDTARNEALSGVLQQIQRSYGKGSIVKLGQKSSMNVETTSSGSLTLDLAMGGGYPKGRVVEIYGPESSGKTTLALHALAEVQKLGGTVAFIDAEHALDPEYARKLGVNVDELFICQPDSGEMALDVVDQLVRSSAVDMIVVDSVAALVPRVELEGEMTDQQMGVQARLMSKALRKITGMSCK